jgi:hypothetical protein
MNQYSSLGGKHPPAGVSISVIIKKRYNIDSYSRKMDKAKPHKF